MSTRICSSTDFTVPSRPSKASVSSLLIVLSWATPPPLRTSDSAPSTSSTSVLRPERSSPMTSPSLRVSELGLGRRRQGDELLAEQAGLPDLGDRVARQLDVAAQEQGHLGGVAVELDVLDPADRDVVDLDRRLRHQVEDVAELDGDLGRGCRRRRRRRAAAGCRRRSRSRSAAGAGRGRQRGDAGRGPCAGSSSLHLRRSRRAWCRCARSRRPGPVPAPPASCRGRCGRGRRRAGRTGRRWGRPW